MMSKIAYEVSDKWKDFQYSSRFLDSFAALLNFQGDCAATIESGSNIYLSFNSDATKSTLNRIELLNHVLSNPSFFNEQNLLGIYLIYNVEFKHKIKLLRNHVDEGSMGLLESFITRLQDAEKSVDKKKKIICQGAASAENLASSFSVIIEAYFEVINHLKDDDRLIRHLETFLRPKQDVCKLYYYLSTLSIRHKIEVLSNPKSLHAEYNITVNFPKAKYLEKNYIGVSKLCCGYCHKSLAEEGYLHRGTHGVCDDKWKMAFEYQQEAFKSSVLAIREFDQDSLPQQNRRLSIDDFERIISFNGSETLFSFKKKVLYAAVEDAPAEAAAAEAGEAAEPAPAAAEEAPQVEAPAALAHEAPEAQEVDVAGDLLVLKNADFFA